MKRISTSAFAVRVPLTVVSVLGVVAAVLTATTPAQATFPGDNGRIAFSRGTIGNFDIFTMKPSGKDLVQLTNAPGSDLTPSWSADGSTIVFSSVRDGNREIYVMNADGSSQTRITNHPAVDARPDWSPDGTKIVFSSARETTSFFRQIFVMNADGSDVTRLTFNSERDDGPHFSPDGAQIVFQRVQANGHIAVYTVGADGLNEQKLTPDSLNAAEPDWSPDGEQIVFEDNTCLLPECAGTSDILVMDADGGNVKQLTHLPSTHFGVFPRFSPAGNKVIFNVAPLTDAPPLLYDVYTMTKDGKALRNVTNTPEIIDEAPAWGAAIEDD